MLGSLSYKINTLQDLFTLHDAVCYRSLKLFGTRFCDFNIVLLLHTSEGMAGGGGGGRTLEETSTWAVAVVCLVLITISIIIEHVIHLIGKWLKSHHKVALYEALEKIKSELMLMGFISLLLTVGQTGISKICVPESVGNSWHPCTPSDEAKFTGNSSSHDSDDSSETTGGGGTRRLFTQSDHAVGFLRRLLAGGGSTGDRCAAEGKVPFISSQGINQLHIFIFVLAVFHILYCISTMLLGMLKMRRWKAWELETKTPEYQFSNDPHRFRFARETSFGRRHLDFWSDSTVLIWIVCFFRQFVSSVPKVDYLTLRHGFIMAHLAPNSTSKFNFQKYIMRSLEEDFKVVVGISPPIWFLAVLFLLFNTHGWHSYLWLPFIPLIVILLVGTKLQVIITKMAIRIMERGDVVKGVPVVHPGDDLFWFNQPRLLLFLVHFVLFQNAFQLAFFVWSWYEFSYPSCFHQHIEDIIIRISMGVLIQILCSYVTLPLYALVTQMGSHLKPTIFNERVAAALRMWHHTAKQRLKENRRSGSVTPTSTSRPSTPTRALSPVRLLTYNRSEVDMTSMQTSAKRYASDDDYRARELEGSAGAFPPARSGREEHRGKSATLGGLMVEMEAREVREAGGAGGRTALPRLSSLDEIEPNNSSSSAISIDFSFEKRRR